MSALHFALWQTTGIHPSQHLALYEQIPANGPVGNVVAHWVLPNLGTHRLAQQSHSLLVEATHLPSAKYLLDAGRCALISGALPMPTNQERLCLDFEGRTLRGHFALLRLRPGGTRWLFGRLQFMPDKFERGPQVAPVWPVTQSFSV